MQASGETEALGDTQALGEAQASGEMQASGETEALGDTQAFGEAQACSKTLGELSVGTVARVVSVDCDPLVRRRLLEMGLLPGTTVRVVRRAPMGDPMEVRLRGYSLSLRRSEAGRVQVEAIDQARVANLPVAAE